LELPTLLSRDMPREERHSNLCLMELKRSSKEITGRTIVSKSMEMEEAKTLELELTAHQDGGNSGDTKVHTL